MGKKKSLKTYIPGAIALVLGIAAFCMMFLDAVKYSATALGVTADLAKFSGSQLAFGYKETVLNQDITILSFNFMVFLAFVLPLAGGILGLLSGKSFILKIIATACFVVGAVFMFSTTGFANIGMSDSQAELVKHMDVALCAGPIIGGVISVLGAVVCFFKKSIAKMFG